MLAGTANLAALRPTTSPAARAGARGAGGADGAAAPARRDSRRTDGAPSRSATRTTVAGPGQHLGGHRRLRPAASGPWRGWASSARPAWTTRARWPRSGPSPGTSADLLAKRIGTHVANDYYAILGVARDATRRRDQARLPPARARAAPGREPRPGDAGAVQGGHRGLRGALRPGEAPDVRPRRRPAQPGGGSPFGPAAAGFGFGDIMDAFFGGRQTRGPKPRVRRGQDALIRVTDRPGRGRVRRRPRRSRSTPRVVCPTCTGTRRRRRTPRRPSARCATAAARSSRCSARSSARS